jgi:hypothetical protein
VSGSARPPVELATPDCEGGARARDVVRVQAALDGVEKLIRLLETGSLPTRGLTRHLQPVIRLVPGTA